MEHTGLFYSEDILFKETSAFDKSVFDSGSVIYEVIRVINGTALFLEEHINRLQHSTELGGFNFRVSIPVIHYLLRNLIKRNNTANGNVKILIHFTEGKLPVIYSFFIPHYYPEPEMYEKGVVSALYRAERVNPNIKRIDAGIIDDINSFIKTRGIYDVLLVDSKNNVTEGSRTNVFFVKNETLVTPPSDRVLKGITRSKVFELCKPLNIKIIEEPVSSTDLGEFHAAFFSGTSPRILPISRIDETVFTVNDILTDKLIAAYNDLISDYIKNN